MNLQTINPNTLTESDITKLNHVVAAAFEHESNEVHMLDDTKTHIAAAHSIQVISDHDIPVALAMYRSCLWRPSY